MSTRIQFYKIIPSAPLDDPSLKFSYIPSAPPPLNLKIEEDLPIVEPEFTAIQEWLHKAYKSVHPYATPNSYMVISAERR